MNRSLEFDQLLFQLKKLNRLDLLEIYSEMETVFIIDMVKELITLDKFQNNDGIAASDIRIFIRLMKESTILATLYDLVQKYEYGIKIKDVNVCNLCYRIHKHYNTATS